LDNKRFEKRKKNFERRIQSLLFYINSESDCRQVILNNYFGEQNTGDCGICDHCLRKKKKRLSGQEFESIHQLIMETLVHSPLRPEDLQKNFTSISKEKFWEVFHFLEAENKLSIGADGLVKSAT
jgi:ATP-dependent DNA helicase RecQ